MNILIHTIGDRKTGMGHIQRQSVLAWELIERGHNIEFVTLNNTVGHTRLVQFFGIPVTALPNAGALSSYIKYHTNADVVIIDVEHGPQRNLLLHAKAGAYPVNRPTGNYQRIIQRKVVVIGGVGFAMQDPHAIDELVDLQIYQGVAVNTLMRDRTVSNMLVGPEYVIIDQDYVQWRDYRGERNGILVSMGGSDPHDITNAVVNHLREWFPNEVIDVVRGPGANGFLYPNATNTIKSPDNLAALMTQHKYLVTALGMTVYEALCVGIPVACTAWSQDHEETARRLFRDGYVQYLETWDKINWEELKRDIEKMTGNKHERDYFVKRGRALIDGRGVYRVADALEELGQ